MESIKTSNSKDRQIIFLKIIEKPKPHTTKYIKTSKIFGLLLGIIEYIFSKRLWFLIIIFISQ